jgi:hypothetical protein
MKLNLAKKKKEELTRIATTRSRFVYLIKNYKKIDDYVEKVRSLAADSQFNPRVSGDFVPKTQNPKSCWASKDAIKNIRETMKLDPSEYPHMVLIMDLFDFKKINWRHFDKKWKICSVEIPGWDFEYHKIKQDKERKAKLSGPNKAKGNRKKKIKNKKKKVKVKSRINHPKSSPAKINKSRCFRSKKTDQLIVKKEVKPNFRYSNHSRRFKFHSL